MSSELIVILGVAGGAALASVAGGLLALWRKPTTLFMSVALGYASGVLLGAIGFEMLPQALELGSVPGAVAGFAAGFGVVYAFDLFIHHGRLAGDEAEQHQQVERFYRRRRPRGGVVTVLAGGTSAEELIEGLVIGVGSAIKPGLGLVIGLAIAIDNLSEGLSIGEIIRSEHPHDGHSEARRILGWTGLIGAAVLGSALVGWFLVRSLPAPWVGWLFAVGAGGMFYLTITDLMPQADERQYQQSGAIAIGIGFLTIFILSTFS